MSLESLYKRYPIFREIKSENREIIERSVVNRSLSAGESIKKYGDSCTGFVLIISGEIRIEKINDEGKETFLYTLHAGELCHEALSCILECRPLNIISEATQETEIYILPLEIVEKYLLKDNDFMQYLYKNLYSKVRKVVKDKEMIVHKSIEDRILDYFKYKGSKIIYATHSDIALDISTSREVVSRKLKKLEKDGIIKLERGKIKIL